MSSCISQYFLNECFSVRHAQCCWLLGRVTGSVRAREGLTRRDGHRYGHSEAGEDRHAECNGEMRNGEWQHISHLSIDNPLPSHSPSDCRSVWVRWLLVTLRDQPPLPRIVQDNETITNTELKFDDLSQILGMNSS